MNRRKNLRPVIIGNSTAAIAAVEAIRQHAPDVSPILISDEALPPYSPTALIAMAEGRIAEDEIFFRDAGIYRRNGAEEKLGRRALRVDARKQVVVLEDGEKVPFATVLIAAGARPKPPDAPGLAEGEAITLRTLDDARVLKRHMKSARNACIIGAGLIGLELAQALLAKGISVHVVEIQPQIIPSAFDVSAAAVIQQAFEERGAHFALSAAGLNFQGRKNSRSRQVRLNGAAFEADLIVWTAGVSPRIEMVEGTPIRVRRGIGVDRRMETSVPGIFAAGDIAEAADFFSGEAVLNPILPAAAAQGRVAAINMAGGQAEYAGNLKMNIFSYFGKLAFSVGETVAASGDEELILRRADGQYGKIVLRSGKLAGGVFVNMDLEPGIFRAMVSSGEDFAPAKERFAADIKSFSRVWMMRHRMGGVGSREGISWAGRRAVLSSELPPAVFRKP
jgi:phenylglyoxylate dehydrogenase epsilon subunit